jgi:CDP-diacylglycerol--glycerol-3-phosphate 3-phosphatidyltransferase
MFTSNLRKKFSSISNRAGNDLGKLGFTPNILTTFCLLFGLLAAAFIYTGRPAEAILFLILSGLMDFLDGSVARTCHMESKFGGLYDSTVDKTTEIAVYMAIGMNNPLLWTGASAAISMFMLSSYVSKHAKASGGEGGGGILERKERMILLVIGLVWAPYMQYVLYIIAGFSALTCLQRFLRNYWALKGK